MKVLAINGSPRKEGNTRLLLEAVLAPLAEAGWETEYVQIGGKTIPGCKACFKCWEKQDKRCVFGKDPFNEVFEKAIAADAIVLGSPTYFADVTSEMKAFMDRAGFVAMANGCLLAGKIGAAVVAVRRGGATHVFDTMNHLFQISQMVIPGSTYWNMGYGLEPGKVAGDDEALRNMHHLGLAINWLGKAFKKAGPYPVHAGGEG
ncbi:MAG: flavodoxin family protein [Desulfovibrio sp.]|jgi:multimeric flavodoxin WrbA|nr:flavodoxin family protein [Desulfovibrio sp.]